jgi:uncharacterized protein YodC (DUF2158 family)
MGRLQRHGVGLLRIRCRFAPGRVGRDKRMRSCTTVRVACCKTRMSITDLQQYVNCRNFQREARRQRAYKRRTECTAPLYDFLR